MTAHAAGDICEDTIAAFEALLRNAQGHVVVNMADVAILGAAGMRVLVRTRSRLTAQGGSLHIVNASPFVRRALEVVGLDDLLL